MEFDSLYKSTMTDDYLKITNQDMNKLEGVKMIEGPIYSEKNINNEKNKNLDFGYIPLKSDVFPEPKNIFEYSLPKTFELPKPSGMVIDAKEESNPYETDINYEQVDFFSFQ